MSNEHDSQEEQTDEPVASGGGEPTDDGSIADSETVIETTDDSEGVAEPAEAVAENGDDQPTDKVGDEASLAKRAQRLDQREMGLDSRAEQLDEREAALDEREQGLVEQRESLADRRSELDEREARIEQREEELDERQAAIEQREQELEEYASELDDRDQTLREYVGDQVGDSVEGAVAAAIEEYSETDRSGRFGPTGGLLLGLAGLVLVVVGVGNALAIEAGTFSALLGGTTSNVVLSALLILVGLAGNLAAATDRV